MSICSLNRIWRSLLTVVGELWRYIIVTFDWAFLGYILTGLWDLHPWVSQHLFHWWWSTIRVNSEDPFYQVSEVLLKIPLRWLIPAVSFPEYIPFAESNQLEVWVISCCSSERRVPCIKSEQDHCRRPDVGLLCVLGLVSHFWKSIACCTSDFHRMCLICCKAKVSDHRILLLV